MLKHQFQRGGAYECVMCQTSEAEINSYKYVVNHIRKQHLLATQCPYWCTLCDNRCDTQEELAKHVDTYPVHKKIVGIQKTSGITINPDSFCGHSDMPYFISSDDIVAFSKEKRRTLQPEKKGNQEQNMAASYAEAAKCDTTQSDDDTVTGVKPIFLLEND
ncbi:unnamed protein product [Mytilus edulis]|uniref:C2H2-type domain-containing protein n=1 Tax=Mytilus edulis TaxID=6550 RepID=A0A8S3VI12_MYTED|nr:unnamed protein product [Mytilus edulis]